MAQILLFLVYMIFYWLKKIKCCLLLILNLFFMFTHLRPSDSINFTDNSSLFSPQGIGRGAVRERGAYLTMNILVAEEGLLRILSKFPSPPTHPPPYLSVCFGARGSSSEANKHVKIKKNSVAEVKVIR